VFITAITRNRKASPKDYAFQPFISVVIPTYNEEKSIVPRIENILGQDYPGDKYEIIVVDSGSTDTTAQSVQKNFSQNHRVKLAQEGCRRGKASAINTAKGIAKGDIILVTDANTLFEKNVLSEIGPHFKNTRVGAVGGRLILSNVDDRLVASSSFYWDIESLLRAAESKLDSACLFHGEINAWRKNLVTANTSSLSEDLDMAIKIRKQGYKIIYEANAVAYEPGPETAREQIIQKKRTALGTIQTIFKHIKYSLNR